MSNSLKGKVHSNETIQGLDGVGIESVEQIEKSSEDGGINVIRITRTDGKETDIEIRNGSKGSDGRDGADGINGKDGEDGKTAYQYAKEGGYAGTEEEFAVKLAQENVTKEEVSKLSEDIATKASAIKEKASGEVIVVTDSAEAKPLGLAIDGKSEQTQYEGNNKLGTLKASEIKTANGITSKTVNGITVFDGTCTGTADFYVVGGNGAYEKMNVESGTYTLSMDEFPTGVTIFIVKDGGTIVGAIEEINNKVAVEIEEELGYRVFYRIAEGSVLSNKPFEAMLNIGSDALPFEPYCGGIPSPNPSYPQEIRNIGVYDEASGKYAVEVKCTGKNLFDKEKIRNFYLNHTNGTISENALWRLSDFISAIHLSNYILSQTTNAYFQFNICFYDKDKTFISGFKKEASNTKSIEFTTPENTKFIRFSHSTDVRGVPVDRGNIMIRLSGTDDTYEPYTEPTTTTVLLDEPLRKGDIVCQKEGIWGVERNRAILLLDGTEIYTLTEGWANKNGFTVLNIKWSPKLVNDYTNVADIICHSLVVSTPALIATGQNNAIGQGSGNRLYIDIDGIDTVVDMLSYIAENPISIEYTPAEPIFEPFTDQTVFDGLSMFYPTTVISNDCNANMEVTYIADTKAYIDKKFAELATAMV